MAVRFGDVFDGKLFLSGLEEGFIPIEFFGAYPNTFFLVHIVRENEWREKVQKIKSGTRGPLAAGGASLGY